MANSIMRANRGAKLTQILGSSQHRCPSLPPHCEEMQIVFLRRASLLLFACSGPHSCPRTQVPCFASVTLTTDRWPFSCSHASSQSSNGKPYQCYEPDIPPTRQVPVTSGCSIPTSRPPSPPQAPGSSPHHRKVPQLNHSHRAAQLPSPP